MVDAVGTRRRSADPDSVLSPLGVRCVASSVLFLIAFGLMKQVSIGIGEVRPLHYPVRQGVFALVALVAGGIASRFPVKWWQRMMYYMLAGSVVLLLMARFVGPEINGAHRWLKLGPVNFQPSEVAKITSLVWISHWLSKYRRRATEFGRGFVLPGIGLGLLCMLVLIGPDFGTTILIAAAGAAVMFIGGTPFRYLALAGFAGVALLGGLIMHDPERLSRIISFLDPGKYADDEAYQLVNSLYGIMDGGLLGKGIGQGMLKRDYLPEAHTDFILAIIGEETGLLGMLAVMGAYLVFFAGGMRIAWECRDTFARLLAYGITLLITLQAGINIGVVTGSMPTKGLPLPFISYGGSNLVIMVAMVGILLRIARGEGDPDARRSVRDANQWI